MVMSPEEMADVLYDMHLAQTLYDDPDVKQSDADIIMLRNEVLKKHDISVEEWDLRSITTVATRTSCMVYISV